MATSTVGDGIVMLAPLFEYALLEREFRIDQKTNNYNHLNDKNKHDGLIQGYKNLLVFPLD